MLKSSIPTITSLSKLGRVICLGVEEIIGCDQFLDSIIDPVLGQVKLEGYQKGEEQGFSLRQASLLQESLERIYGPAAGRGMAIRSGRASFRYILREFGAELGFNSTEFKLLPLKNRILVALDSIAGFINRDLGHCIELDDQAEEIFWTMQYSLDKNSVQNLRSICYLVFGLLQEVLYWVSGGKNYRVEEICCSEQGNPSCTLRILLQPFI